MGLRGLLIRWVTPVVWRLSPERKARALQEFSLIEKDSGCQLLAAISHVDDPRVKAQLFQHVLEEFHHADLFDRAAKSCADGPLEVPVITRDELIDPKAGPDGLLDFVSYVHAGESAVNADFAHYAAYAPDRLLRGVFTAVRADEAGHEAGTSELLLAVAGGDGHKARRAVLFSRLKRAWRSYALSMRSVGELPLSVLLTALYFVSGPFVRGALRRRLALGRPEQLRLLREQLERP